METIRVTLPFTGKRTGKRSFSPDDRMRILDKPVFPHGYKTDLDSLDFKTRTVDVIVEIVGEPLLMRNSDGLKRWMSDIPKSELNDPKIQLIKVGSRESAEYVEDQKAKIRRSLKEVNTHAANQTKENHRKES